MDLAGLRSCESAAKQLSFTVAGTEGTKSQSHQKRRGKNSHHPSIRYSKRLFTQFDFRILKSGAGNFRGEVVANQTSGIFRNRFTRGQ